MKRFLTLLLITVLTSLALFFVLLPVIALILEAINQTAWQHLDDRSSQQIRSAIWLSLRTSLIAIAIVVVMGTLLAYQMNQWPKRWRSIGSTLIEIPIVLPPAVAGIGLLLAFGRNGMIGSFLFNQGIAIPFSSTAVVIAQVFVALPFYVRAAQVGFQEVNVDVIAAARVDGATERQLIWHMFLPLARRNMLAGAILGWVRALGEFGATLLFAGNLQDETQTMPLLIFTILERDLNAAVLASVMLIFVAFLMLIVARLYFFNVDQEA